MTSCYHQGGAGPPPRGTRTRWSKEQHVRKEPAGYKAWDGQDKPRECTRDGWCQCQCRHRWRRNPMFWKKNICASEWGYRKKTQHQTSRHLELEKILDGKKASLRKTYKNQSDGSERQSLGLVWDKARARNTLALLYQCFEQVNSDLADMDKKFDKKKNERWRTPRKIPNKPKNFWR